VNNPHNLFGMFKFFEGF